MTERKGYNGYKLTDFGQSVLLSKVPPMFRKVFAHHVTHEYNITEALPTISSTVTVFAVAYNDRVQTAIVEVHGSSVRPDNGTYHITISLDPTVGAKPVDSNALITNKHSWRMLSEPFTVQTITAFWPFPN